MPISTVKSHLHRSLTLLRGRSCENAKRNYAGEGPTNFEDQELEEELRSALRSEAPPGDFAAQAAQASCLSPIWQKAG